MISSIIHSFFTVSINFFFSLSIRSGRFLRKFIYSLRISSSDIFKGQLNLKHFILQKRYKNVDVFRKDAGATLRPGTTIGPVIVGLEDGLLSEDEVAVLCRGPKFCVRRVLDEEGFLMNCEKSFFKLRLDMENEDDAQEEDITKEEIKQWNEARNNGRGSNEQGERMSGPVGISKAGKWTVQ